jgi:hypothetical protein
MDKGRIAEWLMALVMERPQATAVVGDLLELGAVRGEGWFWSSVLSAWLATVWSHARSEPRFILGMAVLGSLVCWGIVMVVQFVLLFAEMIVGTWLSHGLSQRVVPPLVLEVQALAAVFVGAFYAGQWITRYSRGREIAVCLATAILGPMLFFGLGALFWLSTALGYHFAGMTVRPFAMKVGSFTSLVVLVVPYLLGAAWARRRQQAGTTI